MLYPFGKGIGGGGGDDDGYVDGDNTRVDDDADE